MATIEEIKKQMAANSAAWHTAPSGDKNTQGTKEWYEEQNKQLGASANMSFDSGTGTWGGNAGNTGSANNGGSYTTLNQNLHDGTDVDKSKFYGALVDQNNDANANPDMTKAFTLEEFNKLYGQIVNGIPENSKSADRVVAEGTSGADESLLDDRQYAALMYEKKMWDEYNKMYEATLAGQNTGKTAEEWLALRNQAHANAERIRAGAWLGSYSGGADGSAYLTYGELANPEIYNLRGAQPYSGTNSYAEALGKFFGRGSGGESNQSGSSILSGIANLFGGLLGNGAGGTGTSGSGMSGTGLGSVGLGGSQGGVQTPTVTMPTLEAPTIPDAESLRGNITDYSDYIKMMQEAQLESAVAEFGAAYNKNMNAIDRAEAGLDDTYRDARNQAAGAAALSARNFNELAAANGLNTGTGGQAELARNVTLQNNLNSIDSQEAQSYADLELQRANVQTDYNTAIAKAMAENKLQEAQLLYQEKIRVESAIIDAMLQEWNQAITKYQLQYQSVRDQISDSQWQQSFDMAYQQWLTEVQMQMAQLEMQKQSLNAELTQMGLGSIAGITGDALSGGTSYVGSYNTGGTQTPTVQTPTVQTPTVSYDNGGLPSGVVKQLQNYFGLAEDGYWGPNSQSTTGYASAMDALRAYNAANPLPAAGTNGGSNSVQLKNHLYGSGYDSAYSTIQSMVAKRASADEIAAQLNALYNAGELTSMGVENLLTSFNIGGYRSGQ